MVVRQLIRRLGHLILRLSNFGKLQNTPDLSGDRNVERAWVSAHLPDNPGVVLDFGCGEALLGLTAAMKGGEVTGFDLQQVHSPYVMASLKVQTGDILDFDFGDARFDVIINCSSIEHVGLAGRYGSLDVTDGDLIAMERMRRLLRAPAGVMLLTVPVGQDAVFSPLHRVYGARRLSLLLRGFCVVKEEFWSKRPGLNVWTQVDRQEAIATQPSETFYSLGLFVLQQELGEDG